MSTSVKYKQIEQFADLKESLLALQAIAEYRQNEGMSRKELLQEFNIDSAE
jgi:hypothetical protein